MPFNYLIKGHFFIKWREGRNKMRNIQVNMKFNADTSAAQSQIQQLQQSLQNISNTKVTVQGGSIDQAVQSAKMLNQHLTAATNTNTGKIDFSALQASLKAANTDLTTLTNNLLAMGPKGQQAFSQVANAVAHAELSVKKTNKALANFGTTLMNTIKWQAASTMIHGVMGAFSAAVGHIEKLDKALNNIQIVTGKTSAEMASFAKRAQELSKALSSTTEEYAKASLIYFQQGLGEKAVLDRTEATLKMAKVTGDSVEAVSNQLTAIWNNFDNGTKSLEYYVDVITALGAATASSTAEISDGLQKFAAIAETVGLSYEYAATALATITAETRQSADVVGTSLKTLFARMEGLKLGETLEDGTTLNQYSQAMAKAGIDIKDANGNLKEMDTILNEMGAKWQTLNKDQQVALAQQVGGIRQYNQLIALMDNWDTFKINLEIAENSKGELDKQFSIYQGSIEASEKALQNAKEALYENLFNPKMIKDFNNGLAEVLNMINRIVDAAGGLQGLLKFGGLLILKTLLPYLQGFITNITTQISNVIGLTKQQKIKQVDTLSQTQKKISGQPTGQEERWRGMSQSRDYHAQAAANHRGKAGINLGSSRGDIVKANMHTVAAGVHDKLSSAMDSRIQGREQAIQDHRAKAALGGAAAAVGKNGMERFAGAVSESWHTARANQMEYNARMSGVTPTSLGIKQSNMPAAPIEQPAIEATKMSTSDMAQQISQESAGYTSAILDAKRDMLMVEDQLTEKQRQQYKNYEDQINAENDLLRIARERQLASKGQADETAKAAEAAAEMSESGGKRINSAARKKAQEEIDQTDIGKRKQAVDDAYKREIADIEKSNRSPKQKKLAKKAAKNNYDSNEDVKNYNKEITDRADTLMTSDDFTRTVDFGGAKTKGAGAGLSRKIAGSEGAAQISMGNVAEAAGMGADGSGAAVASIGNLEKLGALQGQYNADAQVAVDLQSELGNAIGIASKGTSATAKEQATLNKTMQKTGDFANKYNKEMKAALKEVSKGGGEVGKMADEILNMAESSEEIDFSQVDPKNMQAMQQAVGKVEGGLTKAGAAAGRMADTMATDMAAATGATKDTFTAVTAGAQQLATDTVNADQQAKNLRSTMSQPLPVQPDPYGGLVMGAQGAMQAITSMAMGAQMLSMGLQSAFDPDATGIERLTGIMMILQGVQSALNLTTAAGNIINGVSNAIAGAALIIKEKGLAIGLKEIAQKGLATVATTVLAVANVMNAEASGGLAGVLKGALAAALILTTVGMAAATVAVDANTKKKQKLAEQDAETAKKASDLAQKTREELDAVVELTQAYEDALKVYQETGNGKDELLQKSFEAVDAMDIEEGKLMALQGRYTELTEAIRQYNREKAGEASRTSEESLSAAGTAFISKANVDGNNEGMDITSRDGEKALVLDLGWGIEDEEPLVKWLDNNDSPWRIYDDDELIATYKDPSEIGYLMSELQRLRGGVSAMAGDMDYQINDMEFFERIQEMEDSGEWEKGQEAITAYDTDTGTQIEAAKQGTGKVGNIAMVDVTNQADYNQAYDQMVDAVLEAKNITDKNSEEAKNVIEQINKNLSEDELYKNFEAKRQSLDTFGELYKNTAAADYIAGYEDEKSQLDKWAEDNDLTTDEALDLFLKINPQYLKDDGQIEQALEAMQEDLDAQKLIVKYDLITGAKEGLKEAMSSKEWSEWHTKNKELFDPSSDKYIGMSFQDFTNQSYTQQQSLLTQAQGSAVENLKIQKQNAEEKLGDMETTESLEAYIKNERAKLENTYSEEQKRILAGDVLDAYKYVDYKYPDIMTQSEFDNLNTDQQNEYKRQIQEKFGIEDVNEFFKLQEDYNLIMNSDEALKAQYEDLINDKKTQISGLKDEIHLASLAEADAAIEEFDLDTEEVYNISNALSEMALSSDEVADSLAKDASAARKAAIEIARFNKAVDEIEDSYEAWMEALKSGNLSEATKTTSELKSMYANLLDMNPSDFTHDFLQSTENLKLAQEAAAGSAEAYNKLQVAGLEALGQKYGDTFDIIVDGLSEIANMDTFDVGETITSGLDETATLLATHYQKIIDIAVNDGKNAQEAVAEANAAIGLTGFAINPADITFETIDVTSQMPPNIEPVEGNKVLFNGVEMQGISWKMDDSETYTYYQTVPVLKKGASFTKKTESFGGKTSKKQSQSGGSKPKKAEKVKKSDIVERYKEINDQLEKRADALNDANKAMDRMYGTSRLQQMQKQNAVIKDEIDLLKQKKAEALKYLKEDRQAAADAAKEAGVTLTFDENGLISNYTEAMTKIYNELDNAINSANADGNASDSEQEKIDLIQKRADDLQSAIDQYDETWAEIDDLDNQLDDKFYEWQDNNAEMLSYKLELKLEVNDMELEEIEYELSKIEDDFYSMAEAAALMSSSNGKSQLGIYTQELADYTAQQKALEDAYKAGEISQAAYIEGMKEVRSGIYDNLSSLQELDKSMMEYYGNTLDMAAEEIAKYTDRMDHQTAVLDHYSSLWEIMGRSNDYKSMGKVLEGKAKTLEDQAAVAKETMEMYKDQAADRLAEYQDALARGDKAAAELYLGQYEAALSAANEAEDAYLSKAEEWAEALKAVLENKLAEAGADLEKALTGGASFDILTTQMERANSLQEEYLTTTNKIYETNKMINTAQQAIDKTTNTVAKQKLKSFQQETAQLQNKGKLSQYELEIQQAKYDLLLAEIALEEAQQAKSTVRLQRDSEGNFGYVYTADASQVSDAEQKLADAQNNLYNIGLEGANNYTQKYQETMREMYDTLTELQTQYLNGEFATEEEYHTAMEEAKAYYYQKLQDYSSLYQVALTTDSRVVADAWSTDFADMTYNTEGWMIAVDEYVDTVGVAFDEWSSQMDTIATDTGADLNSVEENIKDIITESTNLRDTLTGEDGVIAAIDAEATAVAKVTSNYALLRVSMQETIKKYEALGKAATESIKKQQKALAAANNNVTNYSGGSGSAGGSGNAGDGGSGGGGSGGNYRDDTPTKEPDNSITITVYATNTRTAPKHTLTVNKDSKFTTSDKAIASQEKLPHGSPQEYFYSISHPQSGHIGYINQIAYSALKKTFPQQFDTGGYTGSWGSEGKLAMLHQKELILSADDTTNFLASLEVLREIMKVIDLHSTHAQISGILNSPTYYDYNEPQTLEQQVHIEVSFPNVSDRNEIEEAMANLINRASQFVNRK